MPCLESRLVLPTSLRHCGTLVRTPQLLLLLLQIGPVLKHPTVILIWKVPPTMTVLPKVSGR